MAVEAEKIVATPTTTTSATNNSTSLNNNENEHLLEHKWVLWFRPPINHQSQGKSWETSQQLKFEADSVENFWRGYRRSHRITKNHVTNCDYSLFKHGIRPAWEDPFNENGGRWTYNIERRQSSAQGMAIPDLIEQIWLDVMLCLIGEGFEPYGKSIAGGVCGIRAPYRSKSPDIMGAKIHIWTKDASDIEANRGIGMILKECLQAPDGALTFGPHEREGAKRSNHNNLKMTI